MTQQLTRDELVKLLTLLHEVDSVELKLTVPEDQRERTLAALGADPLDARIRQVYFLDTPDLVLDRHGVVARVRRTQGKGCDSVVKLRPVVPGELPRSLRRSPDFSVEVDVMPGGYVCSGSLKDESAHDHVPDAVAGKRPLRSLFSKHQQTFFAEHAPRGVTLDTLTLLGPINVLKLKFTPRGVGRRLALELWHYPGDQRLLEISTRSLPEKAFDMVGETAAYLRERGLALGEGQTTKTRLAMQTFSRLIAEQS